MMINFLRSTTKFIKRPFCMSNNNPNIKIDDNLINEDNFNFHERDVKEYKEIVGKGDYNKNYLKIMNDWKNNLAKKRDKRARKLEKIDKMEKLDFDAPKLVIHNPNIGINTDYENIDKFVVCKINGFQYKITVDDLVVCEWMKELNSGDVVNLRNINLLGTKDFTLIGRPEIENVEVVARVEEQTLSSKLIVFKKKRRKGYKKIKGHRQHITTLRIEKINFNLEPEILSRAVALI